MSKIFRRFIVLSFVVLSGCGHVISKDLRAGADPSLRLSAVAQSPEQHKGKLVIWGGEIIQTTYPKRGITMIEVFQKSLDPRGEPKGTRASEGRFLVLANKFLDSYVYRGGKRITVAGEILGEEARRIGETDYRYPLLFGREIYLWKEERYPAYAYPYPYIHDPWWFDPFLDFPFYWGFHYQHHRGF